MDKVKLILAKYWVGILCAVIALGAIIASFVPLGGYHAELYEKLKARAATFTTANGLLTKSRNQPIIPGQTTPAPLAQFPSASIIKSGEGLRDQINTESTEAVKTVVDINHHNPLLPGVLPAAPGNAPLDFRRAYRDRVGSTGSLFTQILKAGMPPTPEEVKTESDRIWTTKYKPQIYSDATGKAFNDTEVTAQFNNENAQLPQRMREERARSCKVYAAGDAMPIDQNVYSPVAALPDPRKIWWTQFQLWAEEDVANAIADANANAQDVTSAPIKRLIRLDIPGQDQAMLFGGSKTAAAVAPVAAPVAGTPVTLAADSTTPLVLDTKLSPSGRVSCPMYDVVQFRLELVVAAKDIPWICDCIAKGRLMSVLNIDSIVTEDSAAAATAGYFYGGVPVAHIVLRCETLFLREWTIPLMPDIVKATINGAASPSAGQ